MIVVSWEQSGAALRFSLPEASDLGQFSSISLRAALDPLSPLNKAGATRLSQFNWSINRGIPPRYRRELRSRRCNFLKGIKRKVIF